MTAIIEPIQTSTVWCGSATELVDWANGYAIEADTKIERLTAASVQQSKMITLVESVIKEIFAVIQDDSNAAKKSASVSMELSQQARTPNGLISRFRVH